jgi:hypothetical protein
MNPAPRMRWPDPFSGRAPFDDRRPPHDQIKIPLKRARPPGRAAGHAEPGHSELAATLGVQRSPACQLVAGNRRTPMSFDVCDHQLGAAEVPSWISVEGVGQVAAE